MSNSSVEHSNGALLIRAIELLELTLTQLRVDEIGRRLPPTDDRISPVVLCLRSAISLAAIARALETLTGPLSLAKSERLWKLLAVHAQLTAHATSRISLTMTDAPFPAPPSDMQAKDDFEISQPEEIESMAQARHNILVVEDDPVSAMALKHALSRLGHRVVGHASSVPQAIELAHHMRPDLVITDLSLGAGGSGAQAAASINAQRPTPVIFLTGHSEHVIDVRSLSIYGYLRKPITTAKLREGIWEVMARRLNEAVLATSKHRLQEIMNGD